MKNRQVILQVEPQKTAMNRAFTALRKPPAKYKNVTIISFPDYETLGKVISGARLELLSLIRSEKPKSLQQLAKIAGRDFKNVHQDVQLLANFGLIELEEVGPRRAVKPQALYSELIFAA
jgi:predicted transcriptional regulator